MGLEPQPLPPEMPGPGDDIPTPEEPVPTVPEPPQAGPLRAATAGGNKLGCACIGPATHVAFAHSCRCGHYRWEQGTAMEHRTDIDTRVTCRA